MESLAFYREFSGGLFARGIIHYYSTFRENSTVIHRVESRDAVPACADMLRLFIIHYTNTGGAIIESGDERGGEREE